MNKERDLRRTRDRLMAAAASEFAAKGLAGARTCAIARRAGVDEKMIFYCFKSSQKYLKFLDQCRLGDLIGRVAKDSKHAAGGLVGVDEGWPINAEMPRPADGKVGVGFFNVDRLRIPIAG